MIQRSLKLLAIYLVGIALVGGWSLLHVTGGTVTRENLAGIIVFPLAWIFGYWPTVLPAVLAYRVWRLQSTLEQLCERRSLGLSTADQEGELEDTLTTLAAEENGIPERWARPFVRRLLSAARDGMAPS